jgi:hypothetical protein
MVGAEAEDIPVRMVLGSAGHEALALFYNSVKDGHGEVSVVSMVDAATQYINKAAAEGPSIGYDEGQGVEELVNEIARMLRAFATSPYRPTKVLAVEEAFSSPILHADGRQLLYEERLVGVWDLVVEDEGNVVVVDHKFRKRADAEGPADLQMALYGNVARATYRRPVRVMHQNVIGTRQAKVELKELSLGRSEIVEATEAVSASLELITLSVAHQRPMRLLGRRRSWKCGSCPYRRRCSVDRA